MYFDAEQLITFCAKKKITIEQFMFCYLTHTKEIPLLYRYCNEVRPIPIEALADLEKKKYITNLNKGSETYPDNYIINEKFLADLTLELEDQAQEIWDTFPMHVTSGDHTFSGKTIGPEDFQVLYQLKVQKRKATFPIIMTALKEQIDNGTLGMGLKKWIETEQWKREDNTANNISYDI